MRILKPYPGGGSPPLSGTCPRCSLILWNELKTVLVPVALEQRYELLTAPSCRPERSKQDACCKGSYQVLLGRWRLVGGEPPIANEAFEADSSGWRWLVGEGAVVRIVVIQYRTVAPPSAP